MAAFINAEMDDYEKITLYFYLKRKFITSSNSVQNMIELKLHDCYKPKISVFPTEHLDKNGSKYYKAAFQDINLKKTGFIVREDFFLKWQNYSIFQMNIELTEKGISLIKYWTFDEYKNIEKIKFIEIQGIYIDGIFQINDDLNNIKEKIYAVPSLPNRFEFSSIRPNEKYRNSSYQFNFDDRYKLRYVAGHELHTLLHLKDYQFSYAKEVIEMFSNSIKEFIIIQKSDWYFEQDIDLYNEVREGYVTQSDYLMVFNSFQSFLNSINLSNKTTLDESDEIFKEILYELAKSKNDVGYMKQLKSAIQSQTYLRLKLEYEMESKNIESEQLNILISKLKKVPKFDSSYLALGCEVTDNLYESVGDAYEGDSFYKKNTHIKCDISFKMYVQV